MISVMAGLLAVTAGQPDVAPPISPAPVIMTPSPYNAPLPPAGAEPPARAVSILSLPLLFSSEDYPHAALRNREQGTVAFTIAIDTAGRVTACSITESSGSESLDWTTCSIIQSRARFTPARDAKGGAVADRSKGRVRWVLPAPPLPPAGTPLPAADLARPID